MAKTVKVIEMDKPSEPEVFDRVEQADELLAQLDSNGGKLVSITPTAKVDGWRITWDAKDGQRYAVECWPLCRALYDACCWNEALK